MSKASQKRIALVLNALTGQELKAVKRDVSRVHALLTNPNKGMCTPDGPKPIHECQSRNEFSNSLQSILSGWCSRNQLIFYFSGHGGIRGNQYCLKMGVEESDWLPFNNLINDLEMARVKRAIIVLDACYSGAAIEGIKNLNDSLNNAIKEDTIPQGIAIIASCQKTQTSHELQDGSSGVFTDIFCTGIESNLDSKGTEDGNIYVEDIVNYISDKLETEEKYSEFWQRPVFSLDKAKRGIWIAKTKKYKDFTQSNPKQSQSSVQTYEELQVLYERTHPNRHPCIEATTDDIDLKLLAQYSNKIEPNLYDHSSIDEILYLLKFYSPIQHGNKNILHKSAVLCFHKRPEKIYSQVRSVFVIGNPRDANFIREDVFGSLSYQVKALVEKVRRYSETVSYIAKNGLRSEVEDIDLNVARELISNAIAHRDYQSTGIVKVAITPEALEVYSPGRFLPELSWDKLISGTASVSNPVDEAISLYLLRLLAFEGIGRGFDIFKQYLKDNGSESITYTELPGPNILIRVLRRGNSMKIPTSTLELPRKLNPPNNIPRSGTLYFVGREQLLEQLHQQLQREDRPVNYALSGMGGVGKTELALQYAQRYKQHYPGGICWLRSRELDLGTQVVAFARTQLQLTPTEDLDVVERVAFCWQHWSLPGNVLVVLDDVVDYQQIERYLPPNQERFKILITTRLQELSQSFSFLYLNLLNEAAALDLLASLIGKSRLQQERETAQQLCQWLGFLPLGLQLIGTYLYKRQDLSLEEMLSRLEAQRLEQKALQQPDPNITAAWGITTAFELSWQTLDEAARELAFLLSLFSLAPIPWSLLESCLSDREPEELETLRDEILLNLSLLQRMGKGSYQLHPLIREFLSSKREQSVESDNLKSRYVRALVAVARTIPENLTLEEINTFAPNIPHLTEAAASLTDYIEEENLIWVFTGLGRYYTSQSDYQQAQFWYERCLQEIKVRLGSNHPDVAAALNNLAELYRTQGRYEEAEPLFQQSLALWRQLLGNEHPNVASALNNLATLYSAQGRYAEAKPLFQQALTLRQKLLGNKHPHVALCLNNLAELYYYQGQYSEATSLNQQALALNRELLGEHHPAFAQTLNNLAGLYFTQGRYAEAEEFYRKALALNRELLGEHHPAFAQALNNLATLYSTQGRYAEAEEFYRKALVLNRELLGEHHPAFAQTLNNLAELYCTQEDYEKAESLFQQSLVLWQQLSGNEHPNVAQALNNLATLYSTQGRYAEAEPLFQQALTLRQKLLGNEHPHVAISLNNLADLYFSQARYTEAEPFLQKALVNFEATLDEDHYLTKSTRRKFEKLQEKMRIDAEEVIKSKSEDD